MQGRMVLWLAYKGSLKFRMGSAYAGNGLGLSAGICMTSGYSQRFSTGMLDYIAAAVAHCSEMNTKTA